MTTRLTCLLLDDELAALSYMKLLCSEIPGVEVVRAFNNPQKFLEAAPQLDFNTCILDIQMPGLTGLEVAQQLSGKLIIFTTAHKEFAAEAFDLNAVDYIRKPLQKDRFEKAIAKAMQRLEKKAPAGKAQAVWNTDKGKTLLVFDDMLYITSSDTDSRDKLVHLRDGKKITLKNMGFGQLLAALPADRFCRINKKEVIALRTVQHFNADSVTVDLPGRRQEEAVLLLSEVYRNNFREKIGS